MSDKGSIILHYMKDSLATPASETALDGRTHDMLRDLIGPQYSQTAFRMAQDWLKQERRMAEATIRQECAEENARLWEALTDAIGIMETARETARSVAQMRRKIGPIATKSQSDGHALSHAIQSARQVLSPTGGTE